MQVGIWLGISSMPPVCNVIPMEIVGFILGCCHLYISPSAYSITDPFQLRVILLMDVISLSAQPCEPFLVLLFLASIVQDVAPFLLFERGPGTWWQQLQKEAKLVRRALC